MRLGGPTFQKNPDPAGWVAELKQLGYRAAYCPVDETADQATIRAFEQSANEADILIAEVGVWNNPLSPDMEERSRAIDLCIKRLALADEIGARCCVNISGSRGTLWDGPHPDNYSTETFEMIVETTRHIIDTVQPTRTFFTLEPMPWMLPDSVDSYLDLIQAIDRTRFAAHLDPVNIITNPRIYFGNSRFLHNCFERLGPHIKSCHAKDITLAEQLTVHLSEVRIGLGRLNYATFLREMKKLDPDTPLMLEHLPNAEDYLAAAAHVRAVAKAEGIEL
ncbi:MAG: sugar phosphate isomerase/epimerase [Anaerolineales bacterium]|nr:sugar phosphate isomerase/epimerase [Anaerolineales bacterium]MBP6208044.1 sugar phosphate isomerase/epimerase [Anaerolineales bacterium]